MTRCSSETVRDYFAKYGAVANCELMLDRATGKSRGFGFVTFDDKEVRDLEFNCVCADGGFVRS